MTRTFSSAGPSLCHGSSLSTLHFGVCSCTCYVQLNPMKSRQRQPASPADLTAVYDDGATTSLVCEHGLALHA